MFLEETWHLQDSQYCSYSSVVLFQSMIMRTTKYVFDIIKFYNIKKLLEHEITTDLISITP